MERTLEIANNYLNAANINRAAHYRAAKIANQKNTLLGVPATLISAVVGTAIFASLNTNPNSNIKIIAGLISLLGATLSALQTFFKFSELAEKHRLAGAAYGDIKRRIDLFLAKYGASEHFAETEAEAIAELTKILDILSQLAKDSPDIPDSAYRQANKLNKILGLVETQNSSRKNDRT